MGRIIALDHGDRRIGLAISDDLKIIAQIIEPVLLNDAQLWKRMKEIFKNYEIEKVVLGLPIAMSGQESESTEKARKFAKQVEKRMNLPVELADERLTTVQSEKFLNEQHVKKKEKKDLIDNQAAQILLQQYLDSN